MRSNYEEAFGDVTGTEMAITASLLAASYLPFTLTVSHENLLSRELTQNVSSSRPERLPGEAYLFSRSTTRSLLKHAGTWAGDDLEKCLAYVYATRSKTEF